MHKGERTKRTHQHFDGFENLSKTKDRQTSDFRSVPTAGGARLELHHFGFSSILSSHTHDISAGP